MSMLFTEEDIQLTYKQKKKCKNSLTIRKLQIKIIMQYDFFNQTDKQKFHKIFRC